MRPAGLASKRVACRVPANSRVEIRESGARLMRAYAGALLGGRMPTAALRALRPRRPPCHPARFARPRMARSASGSLRDRRTGRGPLFRLAGARAETLAALGDAAEESSPAPPARRAWLRLIPAIHLGGAGRILLSLASARRFASALLTVASGVTKPSSARGRAGLIRRDGWSRSGRLRPDARRHTSPSWTGEARPLMDDPGGALLPRARRGRAKRAGWWWPGDPKAERRLPRCRLWRSRRGSDYSLSTNAFSRPKASSHCSPMWAR